MVRTVGLVVEPRPRQIDAGVQVVELVRRDQRVMGRHHRGEQHPRLAVRPVPALAQPAHGGVGHLHVEAGVGRCPAPGLGGQLAHPLVPAQQPVRISDAVDDPDGMAHLAHPVVVAGPAIVQLADRHHVVPGVPHPVVPGRDAAVIGGVAVPLAHEPGDELDADDPTMNREQEGGRHPHGATRFSSGSPARQRSRLSAKSAANRRGQPWTLSDECGVISTLGMNQSGLSAGSGSVSKTSR